MQIFVVENFQYGVWNYFYIEAMAGDRSFTLVICDHCSFLFHTENWREEAQGEDEQHIHETRKKNLSRENGVLNGPLHRGTEENNPLYRLQSRLRWEICEYAKNRFELIWKGVFIFIS